MIKQHAVLIYFPSPKGCELPSTGVTGKLICPGWAVEDDMLR